MHKTKYLVITGGVISGLGKGIATASIGNLFSSQLKVVPIKCDGYLNIDPGTMNPFEHGEVFVLDDGTETDMDLGTYERFTNQSLTKSNFLTNGQIFQRVLNQERKGGFLGRDVQIIPHVTGEVKKQLRNLAIEQDADIVFVGNLP